MTAQVTPRVRQSGRCLTTILHVPNWALDGGSASCMVFCLQPYTNRRKGSGKWRRVQYTVADLIYTQMYSHLVSQVFAFLSTWPFDSWITIYIFVEFTAFICFCGCVFSNFSWSRDNVLCILSRLQSGRPRNRGWFPGSGNKFSSKMSRPAVRPTQLHIRCVPRVKCPGCDAGHSPQTCAEVKNAWRYTSTFSRVMLRDRVTVTEFHFFWD